METITLTVPSGEADCADWLRLQPPPRVAELLRLVRSADAAMVRGLSSADHQRISEEMRGKYDAEISTMEAAGGRERRPSS